VDHKLYQLGASSFLLDGDNIRHGLNASPEILAPIHGPEYAARFGLTFAPQDRAENIRRIGCVAEIFCSASIVTLVALVSPYRRDRERARAIVERGGQSKGDFIEVFLDTPLAICEARDPKGLYRQARAGKLKGLTGIDDPYEPPEDPELHLAGGEFSAEQLADQVIGFLASIGKITTSALRR
jgi:adenylylsulfate kinase